VPELPEVEALARFLTAQAAGRAVDGLELAAFAALKTFDPPLAAFAGRTISGCGRRGKFLDLGFEGEPALHLVFHLVRGGWVRWYDALPAARAKPGKGPLALRARLADGGGFDVTEMGTEKRLALYAVADPSAVPGIERLGPDPLAPSFDVAALGRALEGQPGNVKTVLTDQAVLAGVGNAYSDEALHVARLSPFKPVARLSPEELGRLHAALVGVLVDAVTRSVGLPAKGLKAEKKENLRVHGRTGQPCPACGDTVREVSFATKSLQYCPTCQTGGRRLADRRLSRLLK